MEAGDHGNVRQYGGYGGFVECCEGVVDPILLLGIIAGTSLQVTMKRKFHCKMNFISALAGLTFFLQQQVVMFINGGRRFRASKDDSAETYLEQIFNLLYFNDMFEVGICELNMFVNLTL